MAIDPAELLLATIGLTPIIKNDVPKIGVAKLKEAADLPARLKELAQQAIAGTLKFPKIPRPTDYKFLLDRLSAPMAAGEVETIGKDFPKEETDLAGPFMIYVQHAYGVVKDLFPIAAVQSYAGPKNITPTSDRIFQFYNEYSVLDDPTRVFALISSASLLKRQAAALRQLYPTLSAAIDSALTSAIQDAITGRPGHRLTARVEAGLKAWKGDRLVDFRPPPPPEQAGKPASAKPISRDLLTNAQQGANDQPAR